MPIILWEDAFLLGVQPFDEHHKHLVELLNKAYDEFTSGAESKSVDGILDKLVDYAIYHFAAEEHWMHEQSYPNFAEHCAEHNRFSARIIEMLNDPRDNKNQLLLEVLTFLNSWLTKHILHTDRKYGRYIATRGVPIHLG